MTQHPFTEHTAEGVEISDVAATSLTTLYCRAIESRSAAPLLSDPEAEKIADRLSPSLEASQSDMLRSLGRGEVSSRLVVHIALRARRYDDYARAFLAANPQGIVVNLGCGMDSRFHRIDDGSVHLFDLDLPEVIALKRRFLPESGRYHQIPSSVLDFEWMEELSHYADRPILFLAEGLLMYLEEEEVRRLVVKLCETFPGSELVCEMFNARWLEGLYKKIVERKLRRSVRFGAGAAFRFGIRDGRDLEAWHPGITFLDEWSYVDEPEEKLGAMRLMRHFDSLRRTQWTVHYRLGEPDRSGSRE